MIIVELSQKQTIISSPFLPLFKFSSDFVASYDPPFERELITEFSQKKKIENVEREGERN